MNVTIEHIAIWTDDLERLRRFYMKYFDAVSNEKYTNQNTGYQSYFLSFSSGARLEIMNKQGIPPNMNDVVAKQHLGIIHIAFQVTDMKSVDEKAKQFENDGYSILRGPRVSGDGYYEFEILDPDGNRLEVTTKHR